VACDPLLTLLRRYQAELEAYDPPADEADCVSLARNTWVRTRNEIVHSKPAFTTTAGALGALEHVVRSKDLFNESPDLVMLWQLVAAAYDYFAGPSGGEPTRNQ
jgi:hypothetical protein